MAPGWLQIAHDGLQDGAKGSRMAHDVQDVLQHASKMPQDRTRRLHGVHEGCHQEATVLPNLKTPNGFGLLAISLPIGPWSIQMAP
eukprot:7874693-Pyramimonas_sp.AAC.1